MCGFLMALTNLPTLGIPPYHFLRGIRQNVEGFVSRWGLTSKLFACIYKICFINNNMQCTIILERSSMFYHCSSDSTVCTACLPSLSIDRCKSTRFPVVGQNLILGEVFVHSTWASCLFGWLLATFLYWTHVLGGYANPLRSCHDELWLTYLTAMSH